MSRPEASYRSGVLLPRWRQENGDRSVHWRVGEHRNRGLESPASHKHHRLRRSAACEFAAVGIRFGHGVRGWRFKSVDRLCGCFKSPITGPCKFVRIGSTPERSNQWLPISFFPLRPLRRHPNQAVRALRFEIQLHLRGLRNPWRAREIIPEGPTHQLYWTP